MRSTPFRFATATRADPANESSGGDHPWDAEALGELPTGLRAAAEEIPGRIDQRFGTSHRWVDRFSRVTLLHPLLHSDGLPAIDRGAARQCCIAQTLLVVHAFIDDHQLDGQLVLSREERLFDAWLVAGVEAIETSLTKARIALIFDALRGKLAPES